MAARGQRIVLADAQAMFREGLRANLLEEGFVVVGEAPDGIAAIRTCRTAQPQFAILDLGLPLLNGIDAAREILKYCPGTRIILLTVSTEEPHILSSLRAGISGYVLKSAPFADLVRALETVAKGERYLGVSRTILESYLLSKAEHPATDPLSSRERQILQLIAEGGSVKEIGSALGISAKTVDCHRGRIMRKLEIFNTAGLVRYAIKHGFVVEPSAVLSGSTHVDAAESNVNTAAAD